MLTLDLCLDCVTPVKNIPFKAFNAQRTKSLSTHVKRLGFHISIKQKWHSYNEIKERKKNTYPVLLLLQYIHIAKLVKAIITKTKETWDKVHKDHEYTATDRPNRRGSASDRPHDVLQRRCPSLRLQPAGARTVQGRGHYKRFAKTTFFFCYINLERKIYAT